MFVLLKKETRREDRIALLGFSLCAFTVISGALFSDSFELSGMFVLMFLILLQMTFPFIYVFFTLPKDFKCPNCSKNLLLSHSHVRDLESIVFYVRTEQCPFCKERIVLRASVGRC